MALKKSSDLLFGVYSKKRKTGRPATGHDPAVTARIPAELLAKLEKWARTNHCSRSAAVAVMIERGLKQEED
jgi:hypothetical protein